ncbi:MAG: hypothetical protein AB1656_20540 [Candidatus Omnitrophota bacterium]
MSNREKRRGPKTHRYLIYAFSALFTLLLIWFFGFVLEDIEKLSPPDYEKVEKKHIDGSLYGKMEELKKSRQTLSTQIGNQRDIQEILRTSTENSQQTMNQLVELHKLNLQQGVKPTEAEQDALAESESLFLENQKKFQEANRSIADLSEQQRSLDRQIETLQIDINGKQKPAQEEYRLLTRKHEIKKACLKLGFLLPIFLICAWLLFKKRAGTYAPIAISFIVASFWKSGTVLFQHLPLAYFKYIAIGAVIAIVLSFLVHLIRLAAAPKRDWLLKQYKEAYNKHLCPICAYPIERGAFKQAVWSAKGPKLIGPVPSRENAEDEKPYSCPSCGEKLYETCGQCGAIRHSLLPHCLSCGEEKTLEACV